MFWLLIRPGPVGRMEWLLGAGAIVFSLVWIRLVTVNLNGLMGPPGKPLSFFGALGVGINEEITKALPILLAALLLLRLRSVKLDVRMWMFLGAIVGLAFGVTEQAGYTLQDIQAITSAQANSEAIVEVLAFAERVFVDGFQHALWAGVSAFFIGIAVNYPRRRFQLIALGIAIPAVLHGLYDWSAGAFASLWVPIIIQALSVFLFLGYTMSAAAIERRVRQTPMFRGESMLFERITDSGSFPRHSAPRDRRLAAARGVPAGQLAAVAAVQAAGLGQPLRAQPEEHAEHDGQVHDGDQAADVRPGTAQPGQVAAERQHDDQRAQGPRPPGLSEPLGHLIRGPVHVVGGGRLLLGDPQPQVIHLRCLLPQGDGLLDRDLRYRRRGALTAARPDALWLCPAAGPRTVPARARPCPACRSCGQIRGQGRRHRPRPWHHGGR